MPNLFIEFKSVPCELKAIGDDKGRLAGKAAVMHNIDSGRDIIAPGAFKTELGDPSRIFVGGLNHNWDQPIARLVDARETDGALVFESGPIVDTTHGSDVKKLIQAGIIDRASIGYKTVESKYLNGIEEVKGYWKGVGYTPNQDDLDRASGRVRLLTKVKLYEVSPVSIPMNDRAAITAVKYGNGMGGMNGMTDMGDMNGCSMDSCDPGDRIRDAVVGIFIDYLCMALPAIVSNDMVASADRLTMVGQVIDQTRDALISYLTPILAADDSEDATSGISSTLESMGETLKHRLCLPEIDIKALGLSASDDLDACLPAVESAVGSFVRAHRARQEIRLKEGRVLSASNVERMTRMRDSLRGHADELQSMIEGAMPKGMASVPLSPATMGGKSASDTPSGTGFEFKGVVPFESGPVLDSGTWDGAAAELRLRKWASSDGSGDKDKVDWTKYQKGFAYVDDDGAGSNLGAYHLLHHDVDGGVLKVARRGVFAAAVIIQGGRGGGAVFVDRIGPAAVAGIKAHLGRHYKEFDMTAPWDNQGKGFLPASHATDHVDHGDVARLFANFMDRIEVPVVGARR